MGLVIMLPPYLSWQDYEPDVIVTETADPEPTFIWDYPWDRGLEISVSWSTSIYINDEGEVTTWPPETSTKMTDLQASYEAFDVVDVPVWVPTYTEVDITPDKPDFWDYFANYYGISTAEVIPTDGLAYARLTCEFTNPDGVKRWIDLAPDDPSAMSLIYPFAEVGDYSDAVEIYVRTYSGTYEFELTVMLTSGPVSIGDDSVTFTYVNRYE